MSKRETYETRTEELITPILDRMNFELVDVEYVKEGGTWYFLPSVLGIAPCKGTCYAKTA